MLNVINPRNLTIFSAKQIKFHGKVQSKPISSSSIPSHEHIAYLILDQKSPTQALQTFRWASKYPNFIHNQATYRALIHKLCVFCRFETVKEVLEEMPTSIGEPPDEDIFVTIVRGLGRARMNRKAIKVLDLVSHFKKDPSLKICNSILDVLVKENIDLARDFYRKKMMGCGVHGDNYTFGILMKGLCLTNRIADGFKLLTLMKSRGIKPNTVIYNTLIHALCKNGNVGKGKSLMSEMVEPNQVTYNILISAYCREENLIQALLLLEKCFDKEFLPDAVTVTKVMEILCNKGRVTEAVEVLERVSEKGGTVDSVSYTTLIKGFCSIGKPKVGHKFLKEMERKGCLPDVSTYNVLISGFCESGKLDLALDMLSEMKTDAISPNFVTYDVLIRGLCSGGRLEDGLKILDQMEASKGRGGQVSPYNSIIYGLYKENQSEEALKFLTKMGSFFPKAVDRSLRIMGYCDEGVLGEAKRVYDQMIEEGGLPSALVYVSLINSLCQVGNIREAFELMNEMIGHGYFPLASMFNALISEFCKQDKLSNALKLMEEMVGRGSLPDIETYNPLIDTLCRRGDLQGAAGLLQKMIENGIVPDFFTWNSLLLCLSQETIWLKRRKLLSMNDMLCWILEA
ncbi:Pentatricopeptide repeat-containing protein [Thalictrum thalictroides]|uniref:Pentatricopeptide repeat-containing protein n=1 Tax=Thalictrum thalictroides TaxID=46969 RepID=A0A7J6XCG9_THATH|nr:Pentatricopeptide repeat-containing protein [Thalictrum thalictroides]